MGFLRARCRGQSLIPVTPANEPGQFDTLVRQPGTQFLSTTPNPVSSDWDGHNYWRHAHATLLSEYQYVCSYSGCWTKARIPGDSTICDSSVDHFRPKSKYPHLAYEWTNYRLARARLNNNKGIHEDVLDPFQLPNGWFTLDFLSFLIRPSDALPRRDKTLVQSTIDRLRLNDDNDYVDERIAVIRAYCRGEASVDELIKRWPFVAREMVMQDFDSNFLPSMRPFFLSSESGFSGP